MKAWFGNLKLGTKLTVSFLAGALITMVVGYVGFIGLKGLSTRIVELQSSRIPAIRNISAISEAQEAVWVAERGLINQRMMAPDVRKAQYAFIDAGFARADSAIREFSSISKSREESEAWEKAQTKWNSWKSAHNEVRKISEEKDRLWARGARASDPKVIVIDDEAFQASMKTRSEALALHAELSNIIAMEESLAKRTAVESEESSNTAQALLMWSVVAGVALAVAMGYFLSRAISRPIQSAVKMVGQLASGSLGMRLNLTTHDEVGTMASAMDSLADTLKDFTTTLDEVGKGNLDVEVHRLGENDEISPALERTVTTLKGLVAEMKGLASSAVEGKLTARGKVEAFEGGYREIVQGVNHTLEALVKPISVAAAYVDQIAQGKIPAPITDQYNGDFNTLKDNLNRCIEAIKRLIDDTKVLAAGAAEGNLSIRADASKHLGDFRVIIEGINGTLDSVVGPLQESAAFVSRIGKGDIPEPITKVYHGEFDQLKQSLNACVAGLQALREGNDVLQKMSVNDFTTPVKGKYEGIYATISDAINGVQSRLLHVQTIIRNIAEGVFTDEDELKKTGRRSAQDNLIPSMILMIDSVQGMVKQTVQLAEAAVAGKLDSRGNAEMFKGGYRSVIEGVNRTLEAVVLPIKEGTRILAKLGSGDLTVRMTGDFHGDHRMTKDSINAVAESLDQALLRVSEAVAATASASSQISSSSEEMAAGAQEQSTQSTEVASAVEEMTKTILENSKNAGHAGDVAKNAKESAEAGGRIVEETVAGMRKIAAVVNSSASTIKELGKSSDQIGEIVTVIDDIADQTNLLALNAAIEAARAGDQGRGFAVVADEVRKLAERTTKATKEIAGMIKQIQMETQKAVQSMEQGTEEVGRGITMADKAGESLRAIVASSQKVTDMIMQIATASEEQSSASEQISKNVEAISSVTAENAAATSQIARAAEDLNRLTENLQSLVQRFTLSRSDGSHSVSSEPSSEGRGSIAIRSNGKIVPHEAHS